MIDYRVISIGCLSRHPLWEERAAARSAHSTTTLLRTDDKTILVDPGLPAEAVAARLTERSGLTPADVTDVFLTNFRPAHRRGLFAFEKANWWVFEPERETVGRMLIERLQSETEPEAQEIIKQEVAILKRCRPVTEPLAPQVDLFPSTGYTPGTCGLLISLAQSTVLVAGDGVPTVEHLRRGQGLAGAYDTEQARASLAEAIEIADWIVCGHDNLVPNMTRRMF